MLALAGLTRAAPSPVVRVRTDVRFDSALAMDVYQLPRTRSTRGRPALIFFNRATGADRAIAQNAPVTHLNHPTGYHGFELFNDDDATRVVIDQTLAFVRQATSRSY